MDFHIEYIWKMLNHSAEGMDSIRARLLSVDLYCYVHACCEQLSVTISDFSIHVSNLLGASIELDIYIDKKEGNGATGSGDNS